MDFMNDRIGHRGYIGSRPYLAQAAPQHVQNLVIRDFCQRNGFRYLLSATEYRMPGCYMMLEEVVTEAPTLAGICLYSIFMLPRRPQRRADICRRILAAGATIHGAVENIHVRDQYDFARVDELFRLSDIVPAHLPDALVEQSS